jgi:hypothetical protein
MIRGALCFGRLIRSGLRPEDTPWPGLRTAPGHGVV